MNAHDSRIVANGYVSLHAVHRYVERVLEVSPGLAVASLPRGATAMEIAEAWCADAGRTVADVMSMIATPAVVAAIKIGATKVRIGQHWAVFKDGRVVTFTPLRQRRRLVVSSSKEKRRAGKSTRNRWKR